MTLMKQARAFGVGVVLATQNPVDVDYKAISNAGTWMIGRLQTERDKARLLDGMSARRGRRRREAPWATRSAGWPSASSCCARPARTQPEVFTTRWAMSYLRGPLTRDQIGAAMAVASSPAAATGAAPTAAASSAAPGAPRRPARRAVAAPAAASVPPSSAAAPEPTTAVVVAPVPVAAVVTSVRPRRPEPTSHR